MNRKIAIICWNENTDVKNDIMKKFAEGTKFDLFYPESATKILDCPEAEVIRMPAEVDQHVKAKNFVLDYYKKSGFDSWLHILEDTIEVLKDPAEFMNDIEHCLELLDLNSYLGTVTDGCNRVYAKYNPRLRLVLDKPEYEKLGLKELLFCSHSNTQWMAFNIGKADAEELHFNDTFTIAMFWIIEYLARRRNVHPDSLYFMNQYVTVTSEFGVYQNKAMNQSDKPDSPEQMKKEDDMFKALKIDHSPNNNIDIVLEKTYDKLNSKL